MQERDAIYAKHDMTDEDGMKLGELEGIVGEEDGYSAESDAAILLEGLDIPEELHARKMGELQGGQKVRILLAQACSVIRRLCCSTSPRTTSTWTRFIGCRVFWTCTMALSSLFRTIVIS